MFVLLLLCFSFAPSHNSYSFCIVINHTPSKLEREQIYESGEREVWQINERDSAVGNNAGHFRSELETDINHPLATEPKGDSEKIEAMQTEIEALLKDVRAKSSGNNPSKSLGDVAATKTLQDLARKLVVAR